MTADQMTLAQAPLRLSLGGGGTDLPFYADQFGADLLTVTISLSVTVVVRQGRVDGGWRFSHEQTRCANNLLNIDDRYVAAALAAVRPEQECEIVSLGPVPAGTGLGSSGAFTVALLAALHAVRGQHPSRAEIAEQAFDLEAVALGHPTGRQDHYACALGGLRRLEVDTDGRTTSSVIEVAPETTCRLEQRLHLFYTGIRRQSATHLRAASAPGDQQRRIDSLHRIRDIGARTRHALLAGDVDAVAGLLDEHWLTKSGGGDPQWEAHLAAARLGGAVAGKVVGAGGGGFLLVFAEPQHAEQVITRLQQRGLKHVDFSFTEAGLHVGYWPGSTATINGGKS